MKRQVKQILNLKFLNSMTNKQYEDKIYELYTTSGFGAAVEFASRQKRTKWEYCEACENEVPVLRNEHSCLICGQTTKPITNDRN